MATHVPRDCAIEALTDVWSRLDTVLGDLDDEEWATPTNLPGWTVQDVVAHVIGTEEMLRGNAPAAEIDRTRFPHVRNDIGAFNEQWVETMRADAPGTILQRLRDVTAVRRRELAAMDAARWDAEGFTPAGPDTYGRFMRIRVFDCWLHEQDIRDAVGRPGGEDGPAAELALDEMSVSMPYVVGKRAGAPAGSTVRFELTGPAARRIDVEVAERASLVEGLEGDPTVTLTMPAGVFARLGGGRIDPAVGRDQIDLLGDTDLGERIVANLAYTI